MKYALLVGSLTIVSIGLVAVDLTGEDKTSADPEAAAVGRARDTVKMLDNVYKQAIALITDKYVHDEDDFPAGSAAVELFRRVSEGDAQKVRLIDATGDPSEPENVAKNAFEREGVKRLKAGADFYEEVFQKNGQPHFRALTPVPVVMEKCVMCHSHYADAKPGEPIGAISYIVPIK